jgi:AraC-like DNA-binding protein/quercetin dioxygenase-like cupin family protein
LYLIAEAFLSQNVIVIQKNPRYPVISMAPQLQKTPIRVTLPEFGISAFTSRHASDFRMPEISNEYDKLCFVDAGAGDLVFSGKKISIRAGTILHIPSEMRHQFVDNADAPLTLSVLCIDPASLTDVADREIWDEFVELLPVDRQFSVANAYFETEVRRLFRSLILELGQQRVGRDIMVRALAVQLLVMTRRILEEQSLGQRHQPSPAFLSSIAEVDDRFADLLQIRELAERAGMCYRSYTETFRRYKGMTVTQYITQRRLEFSQRRMLETGDILGSALASGFRDLSHFYRIFKRHIGRTPREYIRLNNIATSQT